MSNRDKVLLIGWDAADWKIINPLIDAGRMPNLRALVERGAIAQIATLHPALSPMLWTSIATGKRPFKHGIHGFSEPTPDGTAVQPVSNLSRKCKALWNILNQNGLRSIVVGWWPSHPAEPIDGVTVSDHFHKARGPLAHGWPPLPAAVHPPELAETLAEFRVHPEEITGEMIETFVPKAREVDQDKDRRLAQLARNLSDCASVHGVATWLIDHQPWDFFAVYYDSIDHFCHGFMRYHPPRPAHVSERDFELYHKVVDAAYCFHDQMLGTLLASAGPDTRVILMSDHGFHPDHLRPRAIPQIPAGPAIEHRDFGILAMAGPGIRKDELIHGASVLDIAPTVLTLFDLPVGGDMDGKVLAGAFATPPRIATIPSWEDVPGRDARHPPHTRLDPAAAQESLQQLVALGYIDKLDENREKAVANTIAELRYNLGEAYQDAGRHAEAAGIFRELYAADPNEQRYAVHLFVSCQALGLVDEMAAIVADLDGPRREVFLDARKRAAALLREARANLTPPDRRQLAELRKLIRYQPAVVDYLKAQVFAAHKRWVEALECLGRIRETHLARPGLFLQTADLYRNLRQWDDAEQVYTKALEVDPDNPHAHVGMCRAALHRRDYAAAAQSALDSLQRLYHNPVGHFLLGVALTGLGRFDRARDAYRAALSLNPNYRQAHLRLAYLLKRRLGDPVAAAGHFRMFRELRSPAPDSPAPAPASAVALVVPATPQPGSAPDPLQPEEVVIVSGLPRSGTSMLMQMLVAGGLSPLTDGLRIADEDNPRGYFEFEPVKQIHKANDWFASARGKVVKIVTPLLRFVPAGVPCRILFVDRNLDEVLSSQRQMLANRGAAVDDTPTRRARLKQEYGRQILQTAKLLDRRPDTRILHLHRNAVLTDPRHAAEQIDAFLGGGLNIDAMAAEVQPSLHRQRA